MLDDTAPLALILSLAAVVIPAAIVRYVAARCIIRIAAKRGVRLGYRTVEPPSCLAEMHDGAAALFSELLCGDPNS